MKKFLLMILFLLGIISSVYAAANNETGDKSAVPISVYGKTADGTVTAILVDDEGKLVIEGGSGGGTGGDSLWTDYGSYISQSLTNSTDNVWIENDLSASNLLFLDESEGLATISGSLSILDDLTVVGVYYGIEDQMVEVDCLNGCDYTLDTYLDGTQSAGWISGGAFSDDGDGTMTVAAGIGIIKSTNSDTGKNYLIDWSETPLTPTDNSTNYVYLDYNSGSPIVSISATNQSNGTTKFNLGLVFREGTGLHFFRGGQIINNFQKRVIQSFNLDGNIVLKSGGQVSETGERYLTVNAAVLRGGITRIAFDALDTSAGDTFEYYYTDGLGGFQYLTQSGVQLNNTQYDNSGTLTALGINRFRTDFLYISNDGELLIMLGTNNNALLVTARAVAPPTSLPPHISSFSTLVAQAIVQEGEANVIEINNINTTTFSTSGSVVHNETTNKQGGTTNEYYHVTASENTTLANLDTDELIDSGLTITGDVTANNLSGTNTGDQNLWATISSQSGNTTANSTTDTLTVNGAGIATSAISGDTLTITATEADTLATVTGRGATTTTALTIQDVDINGDLSISENTSASGTLYYVLMDINGDIMGRSAETHPISSGGGSGTPGGSDGDIQYNNGGSFGGFGSYNDSTDVLELSGDLTVSGNTQIHSDLTVDGVIFGGNSNYIAGLDVDYASTTSVTVSGGMLIVNDALVSVDLTTHTIINYDNGGFTYLYVDSTGEVSDSATEPTEHWDGTWYNGNDRCIGALYCNSASTILSFISVCDGNSVKILSRVYNTPIKQLVTNGNPTGAWVDTTIDNTPYVPVNAIACLIRAQNYNGTNVTVAVRAKQNPNSSVVSSTYAGTDYPTAWLLIKYPFDIEWFGTDSDGNFFNIYNLGYEIRR